MRGTDKLRPQPAITPQCGHAVICVARAGSRLNTIGGTDSEDLRLSGHGARLLPQLPRLFLKLPRPHLKRMRRQKLERLSPSSWR